VNNRAIVFGMMIVCAFLAVVFGYGWLALNIFAGNVAVLNEYISESSPIYLPLVIASVGLSGGLFIWQMTLRYRDKFKSNALPGTPRALIGAFIILSTVVDIPLPSYGIWITMGWQITGDWSTDFWYLLAAFLIGGIFGSVVCQAIMTESAIYVVICAKWLRDNPTNKKPSLAQKIDQSRKTEKVKKPQNQPPVNPDLPPPPFEGYDTLYEPLPNDWVADGNTLYRK